MIKPLSIWNIGDGFNSSDILDTNAYTLVVNKNADDNDSNFNNANSTNLARSYNLDFGKTIEKCTKMNIYFSNKQTHENNTLGDIELSRHNYQNYVNLAEIKINNKPSSDIIKKLNYSGIRDYDYSFNSFEMPKLAHHNNAKNWGGTLATIENYQENYHIAYMAKASRDRNTDISSVFIGSYYDEDLNENKWVDGLKYNDIQPNKVGKLFTSGIRSGLYPYSYDSVLRNGYTLHNPPTQDSSRVFSGSYDVNHRRSGLPPLGGRFIWPGADVNSGTDWIEIRLTQDTLIGGIGYSGIDYGSYHVTTFDITIYQEDGTTINNYYASNNGTAYTNLGISTGSIIYHYFDIPIYGKTVRFWPRGYSGQGNCQYGLIFGAGEVTEKFTNVTNKAVKEPNLHIKNNLNIINPDSNAGERNSSGSWSDSHNWQMLDENRGSAAWAGPNKPPLTSDFIEIQLNNPLTITGVVTQSRGHYDQYILKFYIDYWDENNNEISDYYTGFNTFIDRSTKTYHYFTKPVVAYKIRLRPGTSTNDYLTHPSIRWGLFQEGINFIGKWEDRNEDTTANRQALYKRSLLRPHTNIKSNNVISDSILSYITNNDVSEWNNNYYIANDSNFDKTNTIIKTIDGINRHFNKLEFTLNDETDISNITLSFMNYNNNLDDGFNLFVTAEGIESYNTETIATKKSLTNRAYDCSEVDLLISNPIMDATPTSNLGKGFNYKLYSTTNENKVYLATTYNDISTNYAEVTSSDYYHAPCWIADEITYTGLENTLNKTYEYFIGLIQEPFSRSIHHIQMHIVNLFQI